jgi:hypothetical protein
MATNLSTSVISVGIPVSSTVALRMQSRVFICFGQHMLRDKIENEVALKKRGFD